MNINIVVREQDIVGEAGLRVMASIPSVIALHITVGMVALVRMFTVMCARMGIVNPVPV